MNSEAGMGIFGGWFAEWITWVLAGIPAGVGGKWLFDWWMSRQKAAAERHKALLQADVALMEIVDHRTKTILEDDERTIDRLKDELKETQARLDRQQQLFTAVWQYVDTLINALTAAGIKVPPRPPTLSAGSTHSLGGSP